MNRTLLAAAPIASFLLALTPTTAHAARTCDVNHPEQARIWASVRKDGHVYRYSEVETSRRDDGCLRRDWIDHEMGKAQLIVMNDAVQANDQPLSKRELRTVRVGFKRL